jgi:hypothetical protein
MTTEIWTDFDPNLQIPSDLKNAKIGVKPDVVSDIPDPDANIDPQSESLDDNSSMLVEDEPANALDTPSSYTIISQTVRTDPQGNQVVDVVIDVEEVPGAVDYQVRVSPN